MNIMGTHSTRCFQLKLCAITSIQTCFDQNLFERQYSLVLVIHVFGNEAQRER